MIVEFCMSIKASY